MSVNAVPLPRALLKAMIDRATSAKEAPDGEDGDELELEALRDLRDLVLQVAIAELPADAPHDSCTERGFTMTEVDSIYVHADERFVVSLVVGYCVGDGVTSAEDAAFFALDLTQDSGWNGTTWFVYDRQTARMHQFEQDEFTEWSDGAFALKDRGGGD